MKDLITVLYFWLLFQSDNAASDLSEAAEVRVELGVKLIFCAHIFLRHKQNQNRIVIQVSSLPVSGLSDETNLYVKTTF